MTDWRISEHCLKHPVHGTFRLSIYETGDIYASRTWVRPDTSGDYEGETLLLHAPLSLDEAKVIVAQRIAELDAAQEPRLPHADIEGETP